MLGAHQVHSGQDALVHWAWALMTRGEEAQAVPVVQRLEISPGHNPQGARDSQSGFLMKLQGKAALAWPETRNIQVVGDQMELTPRMYISLQSPWKLE